MQILMKWLSLEVYVQSWFLKRFCLVVYLLLMLLLIIMCTTLILVTYMMTKQLSLAVKLKPTVSTKSILFYFTMILLELKWMVVQGYLSQIWSAYFTISSFQWKVQESCPYAWCYFGESPRTCQTRIYWCEMLLLTSFQCHLAFTSQCHWGYW